MQLRLEWPVTDAGRGRPHLKAKHQKTNHKKQKNLKDRSKGARQSAMSYGHCKECCKPTAIADT